MSSALDYQLTADLSPWVRYNTFGFLAESHRAPDFWGLKLTNGEDIWTPPEAQDLPPQRRAAWLADQHATQVARARLYFLDESAADVATRIGGNIRAGHEASSLPPSRYGFVLCPSGFGYSADDMRLIACHWGPLGEDVWVSWWADTRELLEWMRTEQGVSPDKFPHMLSQFGNLHYITSGRFHLGTHGSDPAETAGNPGEQALRVAEGDQASGDVSGELQGAWATTLGVWAMLTQGRVDIERLSPSGEDTARDRQAGITPSKLTHGFLRGHTP